MRRIYYLLLLVPLILASTSDDYYNPTSYYPVLMERSELEKSIFFKESQEIENPGKIYYKDNVIYLNERYKGIHVIDNSNPSSPINKGFINIPGCIDIAIKNNSLLADNAVDLVAIDLSNGIQSLSVTRRVRYVFPESTPPDLDYIPSSFNHTIRPEGTIIVRWEPTTF
ncbi:MAG: hypothetical protein JEY96_11875 [Bacteroidales bacterium]|nr:hypothetical protein [Bacteroidales bacterium]